MPATNAQQPIIEKNIAVLSIIADVVITTPKEHPPAAPIIVIAIRLHFVIPNPTNIAPHKEQPTITQSIARG